MTAIRAPSMAGVRSMGLVVAPLALLALCSGQGAQATGQGAQAAGRGPSTSAAGQQGAAQPPGNPAPSSPAPQAAAAACSVPVGYDDAAVWHIGRGGRCVPLC